MIHVVAIVTTKPGQRAAVLELFRANVPNVHAENGCIEYQGVLDFQPTIEHETELGPDSFAVIEKWDRIEDLQAHFKAAHMTAYAEKICDLVVS